MVGDRNLDEDVREERAHTQLAACPPSVPRQREVPAAARKLKPPLRIPRWVLPGPRRDGQPRSAGGEKIKDGRHVGLDFYDLLIEGTLGQVLTIPVVNNVRSRS